MRIAQCRTIIMQLTCILTTRNEILFMILQGHQIRLKIKYSTYKKPTNY
jgi:hypothetical protein